MATEKPARPTMKSMSSARRQAIRLSQKDLIKTEQLIDGKALPLIVEPTVRGVELVEWATDNRDFIQTALLKHGGIIFRDFALNVEDFERFMLAVSGELLEDSARTNLRGPRENVYISTQYPSEHPIFFHNETWWQYTWPMKIFFFCQTAPRQGGATTIADCREVYRQLDPRLLAPFLEKGVLHVRNFGPQMGLLPWQEVFGTTERAAVEAFCRANEIEFEWKDDDRLTTRHLRPATVRHPQTGDVLWFNHAAHYHITTNTLPVMQESVKQLGEENIPVNTYYGDGTRIENEVMEAIRAAYQRETIEYPWQEGNVMVLDNMLAAHGRSPYVGSRKVLVGMTELSGWSAMEHR